MIFFFFYKDDNFLFPVYAFPAHQMLSEKVSALEKKKTKQCSEGEQIISF